MELSDVRLATDSGDPSAAQEEPAELRTVLDAWNAATVRLQRTHETLRDEVRRLTRELEVKNRELARRNRLADLGQMASHVAHEVRNNLMPITLYFSLLRRRFEQDSECHSLVQKVDAGLTALDATVNDLLHFTAERDPQLNYFDISQLVREVVESVAPQLRAQQVETTLDVQEHQEIRADRDMVRRALLNLILNALDVMPEGGELVVTSWKSAAYFELEVADSGPGIDEASNQKLFEPFFTTKSGGTGLGLAIVDRIVAAHDGDVTVGNCHEGGAAFTLRIPQRAMESAA